MTEANADQTAFWNEGPGRNWVLRQADLDMAMAAAGDAVVAACAPAPGERALDVGCGAGATALALAGAVGPEGRVLGVDVSEPLLARARARAAEGGVGNVDFLRADAQDHAFAPGGFDLVASRFGVMFFADSVAAFANLRKAARPGGRLAFAAWAGQDENPWFALPQRIAEARFGLAPQPPGDAPGPMRFRDIDSVAGLLAEAGWRDPRGAALAIELHHPGGLAAVVSLSEHVGPFARMLRETGAGPEAMADLLEGVERAFAPHVTSDGIRIPAVVNLFTARA